MLCADPHLTSLAGAGSIGITTTARLPTTVGAFDGTCGVRLMSRSSGLRVSSSAATETAAKTSTWIQTSASDERRHGGGEAPSAG